LQKKFIYLAELAIAIAIALAFAAGWLAANHYSTANPPNFKILNNTQPALK
jgi:hypothetical protein